MSGGAFSFADVLRDEYSSYLAPRAAFLSTDTLALAATYLRNLLLNWTILIPALAGLLGLPRLLESAIARGWETGTLATNSGWWSMGRLSSVALRCAARSIWRWRRAQKNRWQSKKKSFTPKKKSFPCKKKSFPRKKKRLRVKLFFFERNLFFFICQAAPLQMRLFFFGCKRFFFRYQRSLFVRHCFFFGCWWSGVPSGRRRSRERRAVERRIRVTLAGREETSLPLRISELSQTSDPHPP